MTNIRHSLNTLADALEKIETTQQDVKLNPSDFNDRSISGNKVNGGRITNFNSTGIKDTANDFVLTVADDGISVETASIQRITNDLTVQGELNVHGSISATNLYVDEISADIRHERTSPLEFKAENGSLSNKGLLFTGVGKTKQFIFKEGPDRFWSSENIGIHKDSSYYIGESLVLSEMSLGNTVTNSNLKQVGRLRNLNVSGPVNFDDFVFYDSDSEKFALGTDAPNGTFAYKSFDHEFIVDDVDKGFKLGTWTTSKLQVITDDTPRLTVNEAGSITIHTKTKFEQPIGIGVTNFSDDADITTAGPIRIQGKKFETGASIPTNGSYSQGDIVWNTNPKPTSFVGWVCIREGTPGEWKPFGQIGN